MNISSLVKNLNSKKTNLSSYKTLVSNVNELEKELQFYTNDDIKYKFSKLKRKVEETNRIDTSLICQSFALTREASKRTIGLRHFDTQLLGGFILNEGKISEMKTGEGKTLVATLPAVTQSLNGKGMQIVTVNDYLAKRDWAWMGKIYNFLGLKTGLIQSEMNITERKKNYQSDITYVTNSELGFDYLRDNMVTSQDEIVQPNFNFCIIDEVDSILIDEARTPLIISGEIETDIDKYIQASEISFYLIKNKDYELEEKTKNIYLTSRGINRIEQILGINKIFDSSELWVSYIINALKAKNFYKKDVNYIVQNNNIIIVDEFTGRIMPDRRWSEGLHQSIEAKENLPIKKSSQTVASITYQNLFLLYPKFSGMTGTAKSAEVEFEKIYNREVIVIPTAKPIKRIDLPDLVFIDEIAKWKAIALECFNTYNKGQPVLVGTTTVENSEILSQLLIDYNVPHKLLNARPENVKKESEIIAKAGCMNAVTIATNMAGRGTDIILGGNADILTKEEIFSIIFSLISENNLVLKKLDIEVNNKILINDLKKYLKIENLNINNISNKLEDSLKNITNPSEFDQLIQKIYNYYYKKILDKTKKEGEKIKNLGGLYVIGTERHDSRRIDDQLRGRAGRQGDPGRSRFFVSLNDKLLRIFGGNRLQNLLRRLDPENEIPLSFKFLTKSLDDAQEKVENYYYGIRKQLFEYDQVLNVHRQIVYRERKRILNSRNCRLWLLEYSEGAVEDIVNIISISTKEINREVLGKFLIFIEDWLGLNIDLRRYESQILKLSTLKTFIFEQIWISYDLKEAELEIYQPGLVRALEKFCLLKAIDQHWTEHLQQMTDLRESSGFAVYAQNDPLSDYKMTSTDLLISTLQQIRQTALFQFIYSEVVYSS